MAKKIRQKKILTPEEIEAERKAKEEEAEREESGIEDEFQAKGFELAEWAQDNSTGILAALALVLVVGLGYGGYQAMQTGASSEAAGAYAEALESYRAPLGDAPAFLGGGNADGPSFKDAKERATKAREQFQAVIANHAGTGAAKVAHLYVGHTSLALDEYDKAVDAYRKFIADNPNDSLRFAAYSGLAAALESKGDIDGAKKELKALIDLPGKVQEDVALVELGRLQKKSGDLDGARTSYQRVVDDFKDSPLQSSANQALTALPAKG